MNEVFRWIEWNLDHATRHGCSVEEIEFVVQSNVRGYPRKIGDEKWMIEGRSLSERMVRVIFLRSPDPVVFVIHAMPLTTRRRR